ncbi:MAG: hypothetical protein QOI06_2366 [Nocardioidaceae bacterium]|jgi:NTP pyrophosphatase (non-canonical NTP hydrolase)|nr:hypothetical protein [Nocardioidaceae bacterium]
MTNVTLAFSPHANHVFKEDDRIVTVLVAAPSPCPSVERLHKVSANPPSRQEGSHEHRPVSASFCRPRYGVAMDCDDHQRAALRTARDKDAPDELMHLILGLVGETGEIAEKVKKLVRDKNSDLAQLDRDDMAAELGDVLWYTAVLANFLGVSLNDVAERNVDKLGDRQRRAVLGGSGDNR